MTTRDIGQFPKETDQKGAFKRQQSAFRQWVSADGSTDFPAAPDRYHLYVSYACPWAHRTIIETTWLPHKKRIRHFRAGKWFRYREMEALDSI